MPDILSSRIGSGFHQIYSLKKSSMSRVSRGCLRCRQRRVKCDQGRPSCQRCINRNENCEGYRDEASILFRYETKRVIEQANTVASFTTPGRKPRRKSWSANLKSDSNRSPTTFIDPSNLTKEEISSFRIPKYSPWTKSIPDHLRPAPEDEAVDRFIDKYVMYPCAETSSPGFLEHLPCLFKDVNVEGRFALRWAVRAAAYADLAKAQNNDGFINKAFRCYGMSLSALGESLSSSGKTPDDYDLMTAVMLDIFEVCANPATGRFMYAESLDFLR